MKTTTQTSRWPCFIPRLVALLIGVLSYAGCASQDHQSTTTGASVTQPGGPATSDRFLVVDCLLPAQVRKLGQHFTFLAPRQAIKTSAGDCEIRGGEYVSYDRANYATALKIWLPFAEQGDATAQTYVGEIFEKGLGVQPDYDAADKWYRKAAEGGSSRAAINLGNLYEQGLGRPKDPVQAMSWYRRAAGLPQLAFQPVPGATPAELKALEAQNKKLEANLNRAQTEANAAQTELKKLQEKEKELQDQLADLNSKISKDPPQTTQATPAAQRPPTEIELLRAQKQAEARELDSLIARTKNRDTESRRDIETTIRRRDQLQTDIRALNAGLEPMDQGRAQDGPRITFDYIQLVEPAIFVPTRDVQITQVRVPTASRSWIVVARVTTDAGLKSLLINEHPYTPNRNVVKVSVTEPDRQLVIVATDRRDRKSTLAYRLPAASSETSPRREGEAARLTPSQVSQLSRSAGTYHALVIGNNDYTLVPGLKTAVSDAREVGKVLQEQYGFRVKLLTNASGLEILKALDSLRADLTKDDNLLIYYAGHGKMDDSGEVGYWLPVDADPNNKEKWIANGKITSILDAMKARQILLVADSCYSGTLTRSAMGLPVPVRAQDGMLQVLEQLTQKRSRIAMTSGKLEPVLDSAGGSHSVFAEAFLRTLRDNDGILLGQDFFRRVQIQVAEVAGQLPLSPEPQYAPIHPGYEAGDFVFVRQGT